MSNQDLQLPLLNGGLTKNTFISRRINLAHKLVDDPQIISSVNQKKRNAERHHFVVIPSAQRRYMVDKIPYVFRQATDFRYLTGSLSYDSALVISFDGKCQKIETTLVIPDVNPREERWEGLQMRPEEACNMYGVDQAIHMEEFGGFLVKKIRDISSRSVLWYDYLNPTHTEIHRHSMRFVEDSSAVQSPRHAVHQLRLIKSGEEGRIMRETCQIGAESLAETIKKTSSLTSEAHVHAKVDYESRMRNAHFLAYPPVVAAGDHANTIHYTGNSLAPMNRDEMILVDAGCDHGGYVSDITRTWPLSGKFSKPQALLYEAVLDVQEKLIAFVRQDAANVTIDMLYKEMQKALAQHIVRLGLVDDSVAQEESKLNMACSEFCPHHVSHYLGMDVHDTTLVSRNVPLKEGMALTVEPGIYIPKQRISSKFLSNVPEEFRGIGVRIEDDLLVVSQNEKLTCEVLSEACPKKVEDIEALMN